MESKAFLDEPVNHGHLPHAPGVYLMRDAGQEVLYVGKAKDLAKRVVHYFRADAADRKTTLLMPLVRKIDYVPCSSEREALLWERRLILKYNPFFNAMWKDDKSYPYVKITLDEDFPRIFLTRRRKRDGGAYFGPYPKVGPVRALLRNVWRRKFFALRPCDYEFSEAKPLDPKKVQRCLYYHTGECPAPCAARTTKEAYRRIAEEAVLFFQGKYGELEARWESEMKTASAALDYEKAALLRDNLEGLRHISERVRCTQLRPGDLEKRLTGSRGVTELQKALGLPKAPHHVECFDISHFQGNQSVGGVVCFRGGDPHKDHYRRFRIRTVKGIDDFKSMIEVVSRRYKKLKKSGEPLPDLVVIDGGKGQLGAAIDAVKDLKLGVPFVSLAKRIEEVFVPGRTESVVLPLDSPALHLLQRLRDEAHRFAISYHRLLRGKDLTGE